MARYRIRDPSNNRWLDICFHEFYIRNPANTGWRRITAGPSTFVRSSNNTHWLPVNCKVEEICQGLGDPVDPSNPNYPGTGQPPPVGGVPPGGGQGPSSGVPPATYTIDDNHGDGLGSGGEPYDPITGYPPGYDLPDSSEHELVEGEDGDYLKRGDQVDNVSESIDRSPFATNVVCPSTVFSSGTTFVETVHELNTVVGIGSIQYAIFSHSIKISVYHGGKLIVTTPDYVMGRGSLNFSYDPGLYGHDNIVFIRIRSKSPNAEWYYSLACPESAPKDKEPGSPTNPYPCLATVEPTWGSGIGVQETVHDVGLDPGIMTFEYHMFNIADKMTVYYNGKVIGGTGGFVSGEGSFTVNHIPEGNVSDITIRVEGIKNETSYVYRMYCPGMDGTKENPKNCSDTLISSTASKVDNFFYLGEDAVDVSVDYHMYTSGDKLEVYQDGFLIAQTAGFVSGTGSVIFNYDPANGYDILIRVIANPNDTRSTWAYYVHCTPTPIACAGVTFLPQMQSIPGGGAGVGKHFFKAFIDISAPTDVEINWFVDYTGTATTDQVPFQQGTSIITTTNDKKHLEVPVEFNRPGVDDENFTFAITISSVTGAGLCPGTQTVMLTVTNELPPFTVSLFPSPVTGTEIQEGNDGDLTPACAEIRMTKSYNLFVFVAFRIEHITSTDADLKLNGHHFLFQPGQRVKHICTDIIGNNLVQPDRYFKIKIQDLYIYNQSTGIQYNRPDLFRDPVEHIYTIVDDDVILSPCGNDTITGSGAGNTQTNHHLGLGGEFHQVIIEYELSVNNVQFQIEVMHNGQVIADTGIVTEDGSISFAWNPVEGTDDQYVVVRVGSGHATLDWSYTITCPVEVDPAEPCGTETAAGGAGTTETDHNLGPGGPNHQVTIVYDMYGIGDTMEIYHNGLMIHTTGNVSDTGVVNLPWNPVSGVDDYFIMVRMIGPQGSLWKYTVNCPVIISQPIPIIPCGEELESEGYELTTTQHTLGPGGVIKEVKIDYDMGAEACSLEVYHNNILIHNTGTVGGTGTVTIPWFLEESDNEFITVRAAGPFGNDWTYIVNCPTDKSIGTFQCGQQLVAANDAMDGGYMLVRYNIGYGAPDHQISLTYDMIPSADFIELYHNGELKHSTGHVEGNGGFSQFWNPGPEDDQFVILRILRPDFEVSWSYTLNMTCPGL